MHNILNFVYAEGKSLSQCLRIAADLIEKNGLENNPESEHELRTVFRQIMFIKQGLPRENWYGSNNRKIRLMR